MADKHSNVRPIDANALGRAAETSGETTDAFRELINQQPTLPYAPIKPARWEKVRMESAGWPAWRCSACQDCYFTDPENLDKYYYCPKCGANTGGVVE